MAAPPITERHLPHFHRRAPIKEAVRAATTANITIATALNNGDVLDGVTLATGDRVLVKDQTTGSQNGIYVVGVTPVRDYDVSTDDPAFGYLVLVLQGTVNAATLWQNTNTSAPTIGTTALTFAAFTGGGASFATPAIVLGTAAAAGAASTVIRSDSTIAAFDGTAPVTQALGDSAATGSVAFAARRDHKHGMPALSTATPIVESGSGSAGTGTLSSRDDHVHPAAGGSGGTMTTVKDEGTNLSTAVVSLDFVGAGVTATGTTAVTVTIPGGSGGASWTQDINEDGTSYGNFTTGTGTWSSDGTIIKQTDNSASFKSTHHNTNLSSGYGSILESEIRFPTTGQGTGGFIYGALLLGNAAVILDRANNLVRFQDWSVSDISTKAFTIALDTWYKVRVAHNGYRVTVIIDGTYFATRQLPANANNDWLLLGSYGSLVHFRNIKAWTLTGGAPS